MAFDNLPPLGPMMMKGATEYGETMLRLGAEAARSVRHELDIPYGPDRFQQLDIWMPANPPPGGLPVVVLIHGGAFRNGHKEWMGAHAPTVTALPAILVSPNYRLVPRVRMPEGVDDCFAALAWVYKNIARFGGDPERLHVGGHSAGGHLAALLALDHGALAKHGIPPAAIRSCLPMSSLFTLIKSELPAESFFHRLYPEMFGTETDAIPVTAYTHLAARRQDPGAAPFFLVWGENDADEVIPDSERMAARAQEGGCLAGQHVFPGADHFGAHLDCLAEGGPWIEGLRKLLAR